MGTFAAVAQLKGLVRGLAAEAYVHSPAYMRAIKGKVVLLTYHRVIRGSELMREYVEPGMYVTDTTFERQIRFLRRNCDVISLSDLLAMWETHKWDPKSRYCVLTFDDGWLDNYRCAFPVLKQYGVPATIFLPTGFVGTNKWFWPEQAAWICRQYAAKSEGEKGQVRSVLHEHTAWPPEMSALLRKGEVDKLIERCKTLPLEHVEAFVSRWAAALGAVLPAARQVMNWDEVREMSAAGISFGSHSVDHKILTHLTPVEVKREVEESWTVLARERVNTVPVFCYPNGDWSAAIADIVQAAGYRAAVSTEFGYEGRTPGHPFALKRINMHDHVTFTESLLAFHLAGYNNFRMW